MKQMNKMLKQYFTMILLCTLLANAIPFPALANETSSEELIEIASVEDFETFAYNCRTDGFSTGKIVVLKCDLDLTDSDFSGVPYFNGTFRGCGYSITLGNMEVTGSHYGLFRYIGSTGVVRDIDVYGSINANGSSSEIGGIVGVNKGMVVHCSFHGSIRGKDYIGGIAGYNMATGIIMNSTNDAVLLGTNSTGGIVGYNAGLVENCSNEGEINTTELDTSMSLGGVVEVGTLNLTRNVVNRNNMGGIAGGSEGVISNCRNHGIIGYLHTGYNVGGIVGIQKGIVLDCTNDGLLYGRKDVGGIVGQAVPYIETTALSEKVTETQNNVAHLNNTLNGVIQTISDTAEEGHEYADSIRSQYESEWNEVSQNIVDILESISENDAQSSEYRNNINEALQNILNQNDKPLDEMSIESIREALNTINDNIEHLQDNYTETTDTPEELYSQMIEQIEENTSYQDISAFLDIMEEGARTTSEGIQNSVDQINQILSDVNDEVSRVNEGNIIEDISSSMLSGEAQGVIRGCINHGIITGDLNAGGIVGTMDIEYDGDPELDFSFAKDAGIILRATVNDVVISCLNYGSVNVKKNQAGGIVGQQALGLVFQCQAYGYISTEGGNYLGGIAGYSDAAIKNCYSLCNLSGSDYLGGISGYGTTLENCISICSMESEGECLGAVAGDVSGEGNRFGNYFVSDEMEGIDGISYIGIAEHRTYEEILEMDGVPEEFRRVRVEYVVEDVILEESNIPYGSMLVETDFPEMEAREGYYSVWHYKKEPITENTIVTGEYVPWVEAVGSDVLSENGKSVLLIRGEFYEGVSLNLLPTETPAMDDNIGYVLWAYDWKLESENGTTIDDIVASTMPLYNVECHILIPDVSQKYILMAYENDIWVEKEVCIDGSYLLVDLPYGTPFALVEKIGKDYGYWYFAGGFVVVCFLFYLLYRKSRTPKNKETKNKQNIN